jgi:DNA gyrase subunit B
MNEMYTKVEAFLNDKGNNILSKSIQEDDMHLFVQTGQGLEELHVNDELFSSPHFAEANYIYQKIMDWNIPLEGDLLQLLTKITDHAKKGSYIQRYKGLGEMNPEQLWETTMTPDNRVLLRVTVEDFEAAGDAFSLFMGDDVEPRRNYIETHAKDVKHLDI